MTGKYDDNPYRNSIIYEVEFVDGEVHEYMANLIAEGMLAQVDTEGNHLQLMDGIADWRRDNSVAIPKADKYVYNKRGRRRLRKTTQGWWFLVKWKGQSKSWMRLADMKESHPIETTEFAVSRGIDDEPAFAWWVQHTLRKRDAIVLGLRTRMRQTKHKYGIEIPTSVEHVKELDRKEGHDYWMKALAKEMFNIGVAFKKTRTRTESTTWVARCDRPPGVVRQDGLYQKSKVGPGWAQKTRSRQIDVCWCSVQRVGADCLRIRCIEWARRDCCRHSERLPSGPIIKEGLYHLWSRIWN